MKAWVNGHLQSLHSAEEMIRGFVVWSFGKFAASHPHPVPSFAPGSAAFQGEMIDSKAGSLFLIQQTE